jgi:hypothetical protein
MIEEYCKEVVISRVYFKFILGILCIVFLIISGCISTCIPVKIDAKYLNSNHDAVFQTVIINGEAMPVYENAYKKISVNKTIFVKFETNPIVGGTVINGVCDDIGSQGNQGGE